MAMFNSYVSLPEGMSPDITIFFLVRCINPEIGTRATVTPQKNQSSHIPQSGRFDLSRLLVKTDCAISNNPVTLWLLVFSPYFTYNF